MAITTPRSVWSTKKKKGL